MRELKDGLSGIMSAKNEARFIEKSIDSCINVLDELVVVYNDCTDETPEILERKQKQYPDKLKVYKYEHHVLGFNLTREELEYAKGLPEDSPHLFCNQRNYSLSKVSYKYVIKIDSDQIYWEDGIKLWRDICCRKVQIKWNIGLILGWFFMMYISAYRRLSVRLGYPCLWMIPDWLIFALKKDYSDYIKWRLQKGDVAVSFSGLNLFYDGICYIPFDGYNIHPPYNGEGDLFIFKLSEQTFFTPYSKEKEPYAMIEFLSHPYKIVVADSPLWFHLHANRAYCFDKVKAVKEKHPELFVLPEDFVKMDYREVLDRLMPNTWTPYQRTLFALVHKMGKNVIKKHLKLLEKICL